jgi:hypothetical protein
MVATHNLPSTLRKAETWQRIVGRLPLCCGHGCRTSPGRRRQFNLNAGAQSMACKHRGMRTSKHRGRLTCRRRATHQGECQQPAGQPLPSHISLTSQPSRRFPLPLAFIRRSGLRVSIDPYSRSKSLSLPMRTLDVCPDCDVLGHTAAWSSGQRARQRPAHTSGLPRSRGTR